MPPLWTCPKCGATFVSAKMWHSCARYRLEDLFARSEPHVFELAKKFKTDGRIERPDQLDATMQAWIREAYDSGTQKNFVRRGRAARRLSSIESARSSKNRARPGGTR